MAKDEEYKKKMLELLGERFKKFRKEKGFTNYEQFAFKNDINRAQYGRYEKGTDDLRFSSILKVLRALNVSLSDFFADGFDENEGK